ncbi:hypothetical protein MMC09_004688 [Bachmanniomyces sp. S44760]|nr:hypothetical protein [Bachmanniomyces sp. S44760]
MGDIPSSQALAKRSLDTALMPPPPKPKRIKRPAKVLDEDTYTDALSHIIARDFFPGLIETESQQEYLNALDSQDPDWISSAGKKLTDIMTPGPDGRRLRGRRGTSMTPMSGLHGRGGETPKGWIGETPMTAISSASTGVARAEKPEVDTNMSLSSFQSKYTSEDNESFYKLLDKQNLKKAERYAWMWAGNKIPAARQIAYRERRNRLLAAKSAQESEDSGKQLQIIEEPDQRPAMPDTWISKPDNQLMFAPPSIEDNLQTVQQRAEDESRAPPKSVIYDNTRLKNPNTAAVATSQSDNDPPIPPSPSLSAVHDALAGRPRPTASEPGFPGDSTPRINGYTFVDSEPSPPPSPPRSWDAVSSLSLLGTADSTPNPFTIKEGSKREALHHRMVDKVAKGKRVTKRDAEIRTPVPKFASSPRVMKGGGLTPAAQKLLKRVGTGSGKGDGGVSWEGRTPGTRSGLRVGWTPKADVGKS